MKRTVLSFVLNKNENTLLMIYKKTGQGAGKWNVPGGKIKENESAEKASQREAFEETGITPAEPKKIGELEFIFERGNNWSNRCEVFISYEFKGELSESYEAKPQWIKKDSIPWDQLWDSDRYWIPQVLSEEPFKKRYWFDENDRVIRQEDY